MSNREKTIYTIATAHLDTSWLWTYERSIDEYIPDTFLRNFEFIDKYPEYKFNFEGSLRYELLKEYYPDIYEKLKGYIASGRWNPCGSCYENGDVNIPSPEALTRNILYGNGFFRKEFGVESNDIFIPDCFGFGRALPSVAAHSGVKGFSTCKLPWGSSVGIPFDIGFWKGPDGKGLWSAVNPFSYTTIMKNVRENKRITDKLDENIKKYNLNKTFVYHGNGDRGGAPYKKSVEATVDAVKGNKNSNLKVLSATTKEFFEDIDALTDNEKKALPVWDSEFLMTRHGTGSYTSRTVTKRWNRRSELLADAAERFSSAAFASGIASYPQYGFDSAWKKVITHHFHDDITGTSFEECYIRSHNDYVQAMNTFSAEYTAACKALADRLDTSFVKGIPVVVSNPVQCASSRKGAVSVVIDDKNNSFNVLDKDGGNVPCQTKVLSDGRKKVTFLADVPSVGLAVFDIRPCEKGNTYDTGLSAGENFIENKNIRVEIDENGDISSVFDKKIGKELLSAPIKMAILNNVHSFDWPAWEVKYEDIKEKAYLYPHSPVINTEDDGAVLCSLEIVRKANNSTFRQVISLDSESEFVSVYNETDWREEASLLKAEFSLAASSKNANYDIGLGFTQRGNNTEKLYEVPAQKWADITNDDESFGVSVFSDSRSGWDKPTDNMLRLTCVHTPFANYRHECSQHIMDMGLNRYSFAVYGHKGKPSDATEYADSFCQPMHTFITDAHKGILGKDYSFVKVNNSRVRISAVKKAQESDNIIVRFVEVSGTAQNNVRADFALPVKSLFASSGDEKISEELSFTENSFEFSMSPNEIKTFAVVFDNENTAEKSESCQLELEFNACGITDNNNRSKSELKGKISVPSEMLPDSLVFAGVTYNFSKESKNCILCDGQEISVPEGFNTLHILATSLDGDKEVKLISDKKQISVTVQSHDEPVGVWDLMKHKITGYIKPSPQAVTISHTHNEKGDITAKQFYIFHIEVPVGEDRRVKLPEDKSIIVFAATAVKENSVFTKADEHFDTLSKRKFDYTFSEYAEKHAYRNKIERFLDKLFDRDFCIHFVMDGCYNKNSLGDLYFIINNVIDKLKYKKRTAKLLNERKS